MRFKEILIAVVLTLLCALTVPAQAAAPQAKLGTPFKDCPDCPIVVAVPAGSFMMGTSLAEEEQQGLSKPNRGHALPIHKVTFARGFAMGRTPITVAQFRQFVDATGYQTNNSCYNQRYVDGHFIYEEARGYSWRSPGFPQADDHPVVCVNADDASAYAAWLSKKTGHRYAVPNEAQYEYALRAGTTTPFFWAADRDARACEYSNQPDLDQAAALKAPSGPEYRFQCRDGYAYTSPVGHYKPNPWNLQDMQGNIWEWTSDCYNTNYQGAPADGSTWTTGDCDARPSRGGSYGNAAQSAMAGMRAARDTTYNGHSWGFRVVRTD